MATRFPLLCFLFLLPTTTALAAAGSASEGMVEGRVHRMTASSLTLDAAGQSVSLGLDAHTQYVGPRLRTARDLKSGRQVRVTWKRAHGQRLATRVEELQLPDAGPAPQGTSVPDEGLTPPVPSPRPSPKQPAGQPGPARGGSELPNPGSSPPDIPPSGATPDVPPTGTPPVQRPR
jgi:Domain of unknown function (DUF5666)